jgi:hypothetical protein
MGIDEMAYLGGEVIQMILILSYFSFATSLLELTI